MAVTGSSQNQNRDIKPKRVITPLELGRYLWYFMILVTALAAGYASYVSYQKYIDKSRVYGKWIEIGAPSYATDIFYLAPDGVMAESRYLNSHFEFDGAIVSFYSGDMLYEYKVYGDNDERLRRITGGGHSASFIKEGYEHTIPKPEATGPARRVSLAEHFQEKKK